MTSLPRVPVDDGLWVAQLDAPELGAEWPDDSRAARKTPGPLVSAYPCRSAHGWMTWLVSDTAM